MVWTGRDADSYTSQGLQSAGMGRTTANLADASIGIVGTLGASAVTRAPAVAAAVAEGGSEAAPSITVALRLALGPGHNYVAVTTEEGATAWSHLAVRGGAGPSGLTTSGTAVVEGLEEADMTSRLARSLTVTVPVSSSGAQAALTTANEAIQITDAAGQAGFGAYSMTANSCSTYAASVMNAAGVWTPRVTSPFINYASAALQSPAVMQPLTLAGAAVNATTGAATLASSPTPARQPGPVSTTDTGIPDPANYHSFDAFQAASSGPNSTDYLMQRWASVHGWVSSD